MGWKENKITFSRAAQKNKGKEVIRGVVSSTEGHQSVMTVSDSHIVWKEGEKMQITTPKTEEKCNVDDKVTIGNQTKDISSFLLSFPFSTSGHHV